VLDFGIAKAERSASPTLTREGTVLGSPAYMSPEQARGNGDVDARSDIWALTIVLYQLVTGELPFVADNDHALLWSIVETAPLPFHDLGLNEPELWNIVARGLEKKREDRWQGVLDFGKALAEWLLARGVEEDICHASLRAHWLEPKRKKEGDVLLSFFPSSPPSEEHLGAVGNSIPVTVSGPDSASGVRVASSPPAAQVASAVTQVAAPSGEQKPLAARPPRTMPRWAVMVAAPAVAFLIAALARTALRSRAEHSRDGAAPDRETAVETSNTANGANVRNHAQAHGGGTAEPPGGGAERAHGADRASAESRGATDPRGAASKSPDARVGSAPNNPASVAPTLAPSDPAASASAQRAQDRSKAIRRTTPKRKSTDLKDPFR
jgi:serine/threonine-protein kinase